MLIFKKRNPKNCSYFALSVASQENHLSPPYDACSYYYLKHGSFSPIFVCVSLKGHAPTHAAAWRPLRSTSVAKVELNGKPAKLVTQATA